MARPRPGTKAGTGQRRVLPLVVWVVALGVGTVLFHAMGDGPLAAPPLSPSSWGEWVEGRDPLIATVAVLRLVVLGLSWYLVGATSIGILARLLRAARLVRLADALTVPALRRLLQGALGMSLATAMVASATPHSLPVADDADTPTSSITAVDDPSEDPAGDATDEVVLTSNRAGPDADAVTLSSPEGDGEVTLERVEERTPVPLELLQAQLDPPGGPAGGAGGEGSGDAEGEGADEMDEADAPIVAEEVAVTDPVGVTEHEVVSGESLWTIARDALTEASGEPPSDAEVTDYWQRLIESNRDRLADPDNPDLIFPGQELALPAVDGAVR